MPGLTKKKKRTHKAVPSDNGAGALGQAWRLYKSQTLRTFGKDKAAKKIEAEWRRLKNK
tara:strand:- start:1276 stop:1452 length:177 start_codon:yes stop_codon:yes gene_type:complete